MSAAEAAGPSRPFRLKITGMDCGDCALTIEQRIRQLDGVDEARVNFTTELLEGRGRAPVETLQARIEELGYGVGSEEIARPSAPELRGAGGFIRFLWQRQVFHNALLLAPVAVLGAVVALALPGTPLAAAIEWGLLAVIVLLGYPLARRGLKSLLYARRITIDLLMTVAIAGAIVIGAAGEALTVVLLFTLGEALEAYSAERSRHSLRSLLNLRPAEATIVHTHGSGEDSHRHQKRVPVSKLVPGDRVLVRAGERIPADGRILDGASAVDESPITGESLPVERRAGAEVHAGTINGDGTLEIEVTRRAEDFTISQIAKLVEQAQSQRSPAERLVDRFARWYTPAVVVLAAGVALLPPLVLGQPLLAPYDGGPSWLYRGLALLIVACPCALVISIPVTVVSALTRLANLGVLVKSGAQLDELARVNVFAFDKTGTLTHGRPVVASTQARDCGHDAPHKTPCTTCDDLVAVAASVEQGSAHPFARAVMLEANHRKLTGRYAPATDVTTHAGRGVSGTVDGRRITVGNRALFEAADDDRAAGELLSREETAGRSTMIIGRDDRVLGYIEIEDAVRSSSSDTLAALRSLDGRFRFVMLTGDRRLAAEAIGRKLGGIDEIRAELLPAEKLEAVKGLEARHGGVAMIGDGINDAPALAAARLGVAMGGAGTHQAMEIADIVLMQDDLGRLPMAVRISRKTQRLVKQNIVLSLGLKLAFLSLAIPGLATLWMAVLADVGATVLVTLNGMRMLRAR